MVITMIHQPSLRYIDRIIVITSKSLLLIACPSLDTQFFFMLCRRDSKYRKWDAYLVRCHQFSDSRTGRHSGLVTVNPSATSRYDTPFQPILADRIHNIALYAVRHYDRRAAGFICRSLSACLEPTPDGGLDCHRLHQIQKAHNRKEKQRDCHRCLHSYAAFLRGRCRCPPGPDRIDRF